MHDRAETRAGAATRATASAIDIMILLNIGLRDSTRQAARRIVQRTHPSNVRTLIFSVQDHRRHGVMLGVAEGDQRRKYTALRR